MTKNIQYNEKGKKIGEFLLDWREEKNLTQTQLSKETGIKQANLSYWESNKRTPSIENCIILADYYGITLDDLVGRTPPTERHFEKEKK